MYVRTYGQKYVWFIHRSRTSLVPIRAWLPWGDAASSLTAEHTHLFSGVARRGRFEQSDSFHILMAAWKFCVSQR